MPYFADVWSVGVGIAEPQIVKVVKSSKEVGEVHRAICWRVRFHYGGTRRRALVYYERDRFVPHAGISDGTSSTQPEHNIVVSLDGGQGLTLHIKGGVLWVSDVRFLGKFD